MPSLARILDTWRSTLLRDRNNPAADLGVAGTRGGPPGDLALPASALKPTPPATVNAMPGSSSLNRRPGWAARGRVGSRDDAKPLRHLAVGKDGVEAGRALFDERCFPILVQQMESAGRDAAGGAVALRQARPWVDKARFPPGFRSPWPTRRTLRPTAGSPAPQRPARNAPGERSVRRHGRQ
jgi:hypothetical protein